MATTGGERALRRSNYLARVEMIKDRPSLLRLMSSPCFWGESEMEILF
jgi:hypothetical protein